MIIKRTDRLTIFYSKDIARIKKMLSDARVEAKIKESSHAITTHLTRRIKLAELNRLRVVLGLSVIKRKCSETTEPPGIITGFSGCLITGHFLRFT
jgi:hypothetical protein